MGSRICVSESPIMEEDLVAKILSMVILGGFSLLLGLIPMKLVEKYNLKEISSGNNENKKEKNKVMSTTFKHLALTALNCFGAGVILTTCFTHMLPEANEALEESSIKNQGLALGEIFMICGFLMIYVVEELAHMVLHKLKKDQHQNERENSNQVISSEEPTTTTTTMTSSSSVSSSKADLPNGDYTHEDIKPEIFVPDDFQAAFRGFMVVLAISLHAIFEGIAMGTLGKASVVWYLCFAIAAHKFIIAFCVGMQLTSSGMKNFVIVVYMSIFSLITPVGIGIGIAVTESSNVEGGFVAILQALAAGTLVYVAFFEVLEKERVKKHNLGSKKQLWCQLYGVIQVSFISLGFIIMILVQLLEGEHHHHSSEALELFSICEINPEEVFKDVSTKLANVTCIDGEFNIL